MRGQLEESLRQYHAGRGFVLYESFPLLTNDPTVLFTNATITPFKQFFENQLPTPHNYALIQRCLRVGGGAGGVGTAHHDPNYSSLFDMFGCGLFNHSYLAAVAYFIDMLCHAGLPKEKLRFVVPAKSAFAPALLLAGVAETDIVTINENGEFWQDWRFGKDGLIGKGLTAVFARDNRTVVSAAEMASEPLSFVEIGNLIHIYGRTRGENVLPIPHEGFDVGIGMGRLLIALGNKTLYELTPLLELVKIVSAYLGMLGCKNVEPGTLRVLTDHLCSVGALVQEGVRPGNKLQAFVLRKLIRSFLESLWLSVGHATSSADLVSAFMRMYAPECSTIAVGLISAEERSLIETLRRGRALLVKNPSLTPETLMGTYGVRLQLLYLVT